MALEQIGTSPQHWIIANGYLEKGRDGAVRSGWAKRFFVLTPTTLFYFRRNPPCAADAPFGEMRDKVFLQEIHCVRLRRVRGRELPSLRLRLRRVQAPGGGVRAGLHGWRLLRAPRADHARAADRPGLPAGLLRLLGLRRPLERAAAAIDRRALACVCATTRVARRSVLAGMPTFCDFAGVATLSV